jgi:hypothetical protein
MRMTGRLKLGVRRTIKEITWKRVKDMRAGLMNQGKVLLVKRV